MDCWTIITVQGFRQRFWWRDSFIFLWRKEVAFATSHSEVWLPVLTYSLSNMWYIMCGDNMLKIDVKKTLKNGGENGMIEESAITISHSTRLVSFFCSLVFSNFNFFLRYFSVFLSLLFFLINFCHKITHLRYGPVVTYLVARKSFICSRLDVFMRHDCNASTPVKFNYLTIFCSLVIEHHFLAFYFSWPAWFPQL